jgi:alpha-galactosidase
METPRTGANGSLGFGPLAEKVHSLGLKFGFHFWRGVLPTAVAARSPILGAPGYTAADIVMAEQKAPGYNDDTVHVDLFVTTIS